MKNKNKLKKNSISLEKLKKAATAIRILSLDAIQKANSGHPGMPMGMADIGVVLWKYFLRINPNNPAWINRDRFVLSNGHGSMLQYALLHFSGFSLTMEDIKKFRQMESLTPGHPENIKTPGIESTTGPLGQGFANAVGMAIAERNLAFKFNKDGQEIIDHNTYVIVGDGCLMEGISHEAASLAGTFGLKKLIALWDDNGISIDGAVKSWFSEDVKKRFEAYGWNVIDKIDGHDYSSIFNALSLAKESTEKPSLLCCKTHIGFGSPNFINSEKAHGSPLGEDEIKLVRQTLNWPYEAFTIPEEVYQTLSLKQEGSNKEAVWNDKFKNYSKDYPEESTEIKRYFTLEIAAEKENLLNGFLKRYINFDSIISTRKASQKILNDISPDFPEFIGGSADLTGSNNTDWKGSVPINSSKSFGNYIHYGVREFGMSAIMNGIALHGGFIPYGGTFLVFSDYARNAVRMAALMKIRTIFIYSHDSIALGEDGPTHQPIEHLSSLRLIPGLNVWRPADIFETMASWESAIKSKESPTAIILSRQNLPSIKHVASDMENVRRGAYIIYESNIDQLNNKKILIIATGSEVHLALSAAKQLEKQEIYVKVVSMPCVEIFLKQTAQYQSQVLSDKSDFRKVVIEAGTPDLWYRFIDKNKDEIIGLEDFGKSAKGEQLYSHSGFNVGNVVRRAIKSVNIK